MSRRLAYEDPSIATVAKLEAVDAWREIEDRHAYGTRDDPFPEPFYAARERVLCARLPEIRKRYGLEVARRVESVIMTRDPATISPHIRAALQRRWDQDDAEHRKREADAKEERRKWAVYWCEKDGRMTWVNRLWIRLTGWPLLR